MSVMCVRDARIEEIQALAARYDVTLHSVADGAAIAATFWGEPEAGISRDGLQYRSDTPLHSLLHELCHIVCMDETRRTSFTRHAGGTAAEECAVCYLQILLANELSGFGAQRCIADMDAWGYSFREGSTQAWFEGDGRDAVQWLAAHGLIDSRGNPTFLLRR